MRHFPFLFALLLLIAPAGLAAAQDQAPPLKTGQLNQDGYASELAGVWSPPTQVTVCRDLAAAEGYARERARLQDLGLGGPTLTQMLFRTLQRDGLDCRSGLRRLMMIEGGRVLESAMRTEDGRPLYLVETRIRQVEGAEHDGYALFSDWQIETR